MLIKSEEQMVDAPVRLNNGCYVNEICNILVCRQEDIITIHLLQVILLTTKL